MQIAQNKKVKTRVIDAESNAGKRLTQLGGIVCLAKAA
jgi:stalled ribosome rescue protein Dom34